MTVFTGIVVYLLVFWTVLFVVLPWGNHPPAQAEPGTMDGAPANPRIARKFLITACVATALWLVIFVLIETEVIDFHEIARMMSAEDKLR